MPSIHPATKRSATRSRRVAPEPAPGGHHILVASLLVATVACLALRVAQAQEKGGLGTAVASRPADEAAVRAAARGYVEALERGDGRVLASMWTPDGDIVDDDGRVMNGRDTVAATAPAADAADRPRVDLRETSLRFLSADVAVEDGEVEVTPPGATVAHVGHFTAIWVRQAGSWKLSALRESRIGASSESAKLGDLEWMVGDWVVVEEPPAKVSGSATQAANAKSADHPSMEVSVRWDENRSFLLREMKIVRKAADGTSAVSHITQRIGWDPLSKQLRSWSFGSDGGHAESIWTREGDTWVARAAAVLPDGSQTSSLNLYRYDGADRYTWRSLPTHVGGEHLPQVSMTMVRKKEAAGR